MAQDGLANLKCPLYSAVWEHDPGTRALCFIVPGSAPLSGPVQIKAVLKDKLAFELDQGKNKSD